MKRLFTRVRLGEQEQLVSALCGEGGVAEFTVLTQEPPLVDRVYVAMTEEIIPGIEAAFLRIETGQKAYLPLKESYDLLLADGRQEGDGHLGRPLKPGDAVIVQVKREGIKGKLPAVTAKISMASRFLVLAFSGEGIGVSKKVSGQARQEVIARFQEALDLSGLPVPLPYRVTLRTNATAASSQELAKDLAYLDVQFHHVVENGRTRTVGSLLYNPPVGALRLLMDARRGEAEEILTDDPELYETFQEYLGETDPLEAEKLHLYEDPLLPLASRHNLLGALEKALSKRVWLKSGGFLVIEQTEAFCCIDVNTGKYVGKKEGEASFRELNLEAASEVVRQVRLRNLSGIILVDFINLRLEEHRQELIDTLKALAVSDPLGLTVVDITKLGIVEMTRRKERVSLLEQVGGRWRES